MRLTLPRLDTTDPSALLDDLRGTTPLPAADTPDADRTTSLAASITYSYAHLTDQARRLLPAVSLFHGVADVDVLTAFSAVEGVPGRFAGIGGEEWSAVLADAARVGLLTSLGAGMYRVHPALPGYLAADWQAEDSIGYERERRQCEQALCGACAAFSDWLTSQIESGNAGLAYALLGLQRWTLGSMLGYALDHHAWENADCIVRALDQYWDTRGLGTEAAAWSDRILNATIGPHQASPETARPLWLYTTVTQANRWYGDGRPDQAEQAYHRALAYLQDQPATDWTRGNISVIYHQLGMTAGVRGRLDEADDWYRQAIRIRKQLGLRDLLASDYHQVGTTAYLRGKLDDADDWYRQALVIEEELGNRTGMALTYHELGMTAQDRGRLDEADNWYRKSLAIKEELGNRPGVAISYHQLGRIAYLRGRLDEADNWYRQSLTIKEELGDRPGLAQTYTNVGRVAEDRAQPRSALAWNVRCVSLFDEFPSPLTVSGPSAIKRLTRQLGMPALEEVWHQVTGQPLPQPVRDYVTSHQDEQPAGES
jgi:tetratricopeptide (TPR) repeat protein